MSYIAGKSKTYFPWVGNILTGQELVAKKPSLLAISAIFYTPNLECAIAAFRYKNPTIQAKKGMGIFDGSAIVYLCQQDAAFHIPKEDRTSRAVPSGIALSFDLDPIRKIKVA